jgi:hypothetical protein
VAARPDDARPRPWSGWVPVATPPTVPWQRPAGRRIAAGSAGRSGVGTAVRGIAAAVADEVLRKLAARIEAASPAAAGRSVDLGAGAAPEPGAMAGSGTGAGPDAVAGVAARDTGPSPGSAGSAGAVGSAGTAGSAGAAGAQWPAAGAQVRAAVADARRLALERAAAGAGDRLAALRHAVTRRRDPARVHARRMRHARRATVVRSAAAGGLGWAAAVAYPAAGLQPGEAALGGGAAVLAVGAVNAGLRLHRLRRTPVPAPRPRDLPRPARPPRDCPSRGPLDRLAERERALAGLLVHLGAAGEEPRAVALDAAATLCELGARVTAVHQARRGAPPASVAGLDAAVAALVAQLEAGVAGYDALVVAAADAVAASATLQAGDPVLLLRLTEATDSLAGLAAGLRAVTR